MGCACGKNDDQVGGVRQSKIPRQNSECDSKGIQMKLLDDKMLRNLGQYWTMYNVPGEGFGLREGQDRVVFKSYHGKWMSAEDSRLVANRDEVGQWEKFIPIP